MKIRPITISLVFLLFLIASISAQQSYLGTFKQGECVKLIQLCPTCSYVNITSITYNSKDLLQDKQMQKRGTEFNYTFCNTSGLGTYVVNGVGDLDGTPTVFAYDFEITQSGSNNSLSSAISYISLLIILVVFLITSIMIFIKFDNLLSRVFSFGISYLLLVAITFVSWNLSDEFMWSLTFVGDFFKFLFFILMWLALPLLIGSFVWYFLMLWKVKEIENLMTKGLSFEEAERRTKKYK